MHGMIMVIYLLTALFLGGFGNYLIPLMVGARDYVFSLCEHAELLGLFLAVLVLVASSRTRRAHGRRLDPISAPGHSRRHPWTGLGHHSDAGFPNPVIIGFTMGGLNYVVTVLQGRTRG